MTLGSIDGSRAYAGMGEVALVTGAVAAARSLGPTAIPRTATGIATVAGASAGMGVVAGLAGEGVARLLDAGTPLDRPQAHGAVGAAGLAAALIGRKVGGTAGAAASSVGTILAATGGAGLALDAAHARFDRDADGHFFPRVPLAVEVGVGGLVVGGLGLKYGRQAMTAMQNAKLLAGSAAEVDKAGAALGELIPRSSLTTGPQVFLGARIDDGFGAVARRVVMPHKIDAPAVRASLGLPEQGTLTPDQLAAVAIRSADNQGSYALDAAGKPVVQLHLMGSPTGMGGMNVAPVMMAEQLVPTATYNAQYGARPSVQSLNKVDEAIAHYEALAKAHKARMSEIPEAVRPPTVGVATSLGGMPFGELIATRGPGVLDELGLSKAVTLGAPHNLSKLDPAVLPDGFHIRTTIEGLASYSDEQIANARFIELKWGDDPVPLTSLRMAFERPDWFAANRSFTPGVSLAQHGVDVTTAISRGTGPVIGTRGHEMRAREVNAAFARAVGLGDVADPSVQRAAIRAEEAAVAEAKRARDVLFGRAPVPASAAAG